MGDKYKVWDIAMLSDEEFETLMTFWQGSQFGEYFLWSRRVSKMSAEEIRLEVKRYKTILRAKSML